MKDKTPNSDVARTLGIDGARGSHVNSFKWLRSGIAVLAILAVIIVSQSMNNAVDVE